MVSLECPSLPARASLRREGRSPCAHRGHGIPGWLAACPPLFAPSLTPSLRQVLAKSIRNLKQGVHDIGEKTACDLQDFATITEETIGMIGNWVPER